MYPPKDKSVLIQMMILSSTNPPPQLEEKTPLKFIFWNINRGSVTSRELSGSGWGVGAVACHFPSVSVLSVLFDSWILSKHFSNISLLAPLASLTLSSQNIGEIFI